MYIDRGEREGSANGSPSPKIKKTQKEKKIDVMLGLKISLFPKEFSVNAPVHVCVYM